MNRVDQCLYSITSGLMLFPALVLYFPSCPLGDYALRSRVIVNYPFSLAHNGAWFIEHGHLYECLSQGHEA